MERINHAVDEACFKFDPVSATFIKQLIEDWRCEDGAVGGQRLATLRETIGSLLQSAGSTQEQLSEIIAGLTKLKCSDEQSNAYQMANAVVPIENPVQMNLSPLTKIMTQSQKVKLDSLSTKRVMASQVDKEQLRKVVSRHKQRAEKRGLKSRKTFEFEDARNGAEEGARKKVEWSPMIIVDGLIADHLSGGGGPSTHGKRDIQLVDFDISLGGKRILTDANLTLAHGRIYGLVGRNGVGKSTLLRNIADRQIEGIPTTLSILHVEQEVVGDDTTALQSVLSADWKRSALMEEEQRIQEALRMLTERIAEGTAGSKAASEEAKLGARLAAVYALLSEVADESTAETRAAMILSGLGFSNCEQGRPTSSFSGGWRMRIALARALYCQPDLLLLDEPTNMLDFPSVVWLQGYLGGWDGTILVVSHDRCFLDQVATDMLHMLAEKIDPYRGNYSSFTKTRQERQINQQREYDSQVAYRQGLQEFIDRWRYNANRAPQAQSRLKILEKLPPLMPVVKEAPVIFKFPAAESISPPILQLENVSFRYEKNVEAADGDDGAGSAPTAANNAAPPSEAGESVSRWIVKHVDFNVQPGSKMAIVGPNGAGKTTLLKLLDGQLNPTQGILHRHGRLRIAMFTQHHVDQLNLSQSSLELLKERFPGEDEEVYRHALGSFGLSGPLALQTIGTLSGGQKSRICFVLLAMIKPHIMILDEPTNHLDMDTIDALVKALREWNGGVLVVSHDKKFVDDVADEIWVCDDGAVGRFDSDDIFKYAQTLLD